MNKRANALQSRLHRTGRYNTDNRRREWWWIAGLLVAGLLVRLWLGGRYPGFMDDQNLFVQWMNDVRQYGMGTVYMHNHGINYPPIFLALMSIYAAVLHLFGIQATAGTLSYKGILIVLDLLSFIAVAIWARGKAGVIARPLLLALFALNPVLIVDGAIWGQVDILNGMLMTGSLLLILSAPLIAGILFALALLTKFQAIVIAPVFGWYMLRTLWKRQLRPLLLFLAGALLPLLLTALYFALYGGFTAMIRGAYLSAVGMYKQVTLNAFNIWYYLVGTAPDTSDTIKLWNVISLRNIGFVLLLLAVLYTGWYIGRRRTLNTATMLKAGAWISFAFFMLPTEIHERYSVPALIMLLLITLLDRRWIPLALLLSVTITYNLWAVMTSYLPPTPGIIVSCIHVVALLWMAWLILQDLRTQHQHRNPQNHSTNPDHPQPTNTNNT
ncbi:hypothetical protein [Paenibacillus sp. WLX2291]|uniref:hypothetical protein n=1 Tax=Paenibacillus sp. WLX2291 TaxID=3296934 RepID=UPI0039840E32